MIQFCKRTLHFNRSKLVTSSHARFTKFSVFLISDIQVSTSVNKNQLLSIRHLPETVIRHLPETFIRHLPETVIRHLPKTVIRHLPETVIRHLPETVIRHLPETA